MVNKWTRDDLPAVMDLVKASVDAVATDPSGGADAALDAVVDHLNAHHPKPVPGMLWATKADADRWRRAHAIVESERDQVRESFRRLCAETDLDLFTVRDQLKQCRGEREQMTRERDEAQERADQLRDERDDAVQSCITVGRDRDEWKARAEAAEARTAVTRADIEKSLRKAFTEDLGLARTTDAVWPLVSGADPAVFVVRESQLPDVERDEDGDWLCENTPVVSGKDTAEDVRGRALPQLKYVAVREAVARAIEAEQVVDPVEELAGQIEAAARTAIRQVCDDLAAVAPSLDPLTVERAMEVTAASRKVAAHVFGQGAGDE